MTQVLITGAGGFIGSHLVESQLKRGHRVRALDLQLDRLSHLAVHSNLERVNGDIRDGRLVERMVEDVDIVYHLCSAHLDHSQPDKYYWSVNVEASERLVDAAADAGVRRLVHCSSVGVIGDVTNPPATEESACHPTNIYERTKLAGEQVVLRRAAIRQYPVVVVRPAWVYGPRCPRTAKLFRAVGTGRFLFFGDGRNLRHPIYISDMVRAFEACAVRDGIAGQIYHIAGAQPVTVKQLIETIADVLEVRPPFLHLPVQLGIGIASMLDLMIKPFGKAPPFSRRSIDFFLKNNAYAIGKARRDLGFRPVVDLRAGLAEVRREIDRLESNRHTRGRIDGKPNEGGSELHS